MSRASGWFHKEALHGEWLFMTFGAFLLSAAILYLAVLVGVMMFDSAIVLLPVFIVMGLSYGIYKLVHHHRLAHIHK